MFKVLKKYSLAVLAAVLIAAGIGIWNSYGSKTRVAFVNYPEFLLAPLLDQKLSSSIEVDALKWTEESGKELEDYDFALFFGMGLHFTEAQQEILKNLKTPVFTTAATRRETALAEMSEKHSNAIREYLKQGGKTNFRRMLDYIRYEIDGKRIFAAVPEAPLEIESTNYFHIKEENAFKTYDEYIAWYKDGNGWKENAATVCLLSGNGGGALESLIGALERKGLNVVAARGMWGITKDLDKIKPDLIIYQPHGRLGDEAVEYLKKFNIPLFCPIKAHQLYDEFLKDQRGMTGGLLSQSITMPELDGGVTPFVLSALFKNERGLQDFRTIPDRLERFSELVRKTTALKKIPNSEKKIALIYYGSITKESATAGLGVSQSVLNILKRLQKEGYTTGPLPETVDDLDREIKANSAIFGTNAGTQKGSKNVADAKVRTLTITPQEYHAWIKKSMPDDLYATVTDRYGEFPGKNFRTPEGNMAIGCIRFGNVVLMPQSLPGEGSEESKLIHGVKMAPPHTYIATYLYLRHGFQADAMMHIGTHGSLEFTPWKQVALSSYDWPDVLIGEMPHFYLYIINNPGEAQIAKRRAYATMISHLTPPFMNSEAYGYVSVLQEKLNHFETAENAMLKAEYGKSIIELVKKENIDRDLNLSDALTRGELTADDLLRLQNFLHEISDAKVNRGAYILGRPYTEEEANETARLMAVDAIADALFKADLKAGKVQESRRKDLAFFRKNYLEPAHARAREALDNPEKFSGQLSASNGNANAPVVGSPEMKKPAMSGKLSDGREVPPEMQATMRQMAAAAAMRRRSESVPAPKLSPEAVVIRAKKDLLASTENELDAIVNAFAGGYTSAASGGDPILNPDTVPTGKNIYGIDPERTPTKESFEVGKQLADALIAEKLKSEGTYPKKVGFSLWGGEFIRTQGTNIAEIFALLGVEPIWDSRGRVQDVRLIPLSELKRPRIDVLVQTSGQFRGAATSRMRLIDKAVRLAAEDNATEFENYVRDGSLEVAKAMIASGMSPEQAKALSNSRIFGGVNGNFGTGVTGMTQSTGKWEDAKEIAELYLNNMGALYTEGHWGEHVPEMFKAALANTDTVVQSRSSNSWGPLSLDHVYEFTGGLSLVARHVTGKDPAAFFNDLRTPGFARIQDAGEAAMIEARSTVLNPKYIREMMKEGAATTGAFVEVFRNTLGWEVMKPEMLEDHLWQSYKEVYVDDALGLDVREYFENNNPVALQEMTGVMLEAVRKEFWKADEATVQKIAQTHAELVRKFDLDPLPNEKLSEMVKANLADPELRKAYEAQIAKSKERRRQAEEARKQAEEVSGQKLKEHTVRIDEPDEDGNRSALFIIGGIVLFGILAIALGNRKKKL